jgi:hypothetical protein
MEKYNNITNTGREIMFLSGINRLFLYTVCFFRKGNSPIQALETVI